jgi:acyl-CoA thioester hydrolase
MTIPRPQNDEAMKAVPGTNDARGRFEGKTHILPLRVYFGETDKAGVLHHAQYFIFAERGRTEMLESVLQRAGEGKSFADFNFALRQAGARFFQPARLNDIVEMHTSVAETGGASLLLRQRLRRGRETLAALSIELVFIDESLKPARIPKRLRDALSALADPPPQTTEE